MGLSTLPLNHWMSIPYGQLSNSLRAVFPLVSTITSAISPKWMLQTLKTSHFFIKQPIHFWLHSMSIYYRYLHIIYVCIHIYMYHIYIYV